MGRISLNTETNAAKCKRVDLSRRQIAEHVRDQTRQGMSITQAVTAFARDAAAGQLPLPLSIALHGCWERGRKLQVSQSTIRRWFDEAFPDFLEDRKLEALRQLESGVGAAEVAQQAGVTRRTVQNWKRERGSSRSL